MGLSLIRSIWTPSHTIAEADELMGRYRISGVPVVETLENRKLVGILTNRDLRLFLITINLFQII